MQSKVHQFTSSLFRQITNYNGLISGKNITSRIECEFVNNITSLSTPSPTPVVGGMPISIARKKSSSSGWVSSSPPLPHSTCSSSSLRCKIGSFSSVYEFPNSHLYIYGSNLSAKITFSGSFFISSSSSIEYVLRGLHSGVVSIGKS